MRRWNEMDCDYFKGCVYVKITSINIPKDFMKKGLKNININRLGDIVLIAGKNGAGKTRFLDIIFECVNKHILTPNALEVTTEQISSFESALKTSPDAPHVAGWKSEIAKNTEKIKIDSYFRLDNRQDKHIAIRFVPNKLSFVDPATQTDSQREIMHDTAKNCEMIESLNQYVLAYIQLECDRFFFATHQDHINDTESPGFRESFNRLNDLILAFLGTKILRIGNKCTIFNMEIGKSQLSDGQKVLLQLCVQIHAYGATIASLILLLDEPENHLHPEAQIEFINKVKSALMSGQMWIATHSVHILSSLEMSDIWYMKDGDIKYAGKEPEEVLYGLLGGRNNVEQLHIFLSSPAMFAANQFANECLFAPNAVITEREDKQMAQVSAILEKLRQENRYLKLLDYGAGKGRLLSSIMEEESEQSKLTDWLDYYAFDKYPQDREICENAIIRVYGNSTNHYFNNENDMLGYNDEKSFDIVVMCNVLHEISPDEWVNTFSSGSLLGRLLSDEGYLLIIEDNAIPKGELPNKDGFFILGRTELKSLFNIPADDTDFVTVSFNDENRLFAHLIPKKHLLNITEDTIRAALGILRNKCRDEIKRIREQETYRNGRLLGLWSQQLANLVLYSE